VLDKGQGNILRNWSLVLSHELTDSRYSLPPRGEERHRRSPHQPSVPQRL